MAAPAIPQNFAVQQGNGQVLLSWDLVPGATSYPIQRSTDNITFSALAAPNAYQYLDTTVVPGTQYFYKLASSNGTVSFYTSVQSVVPLMSGQMTLGQVRLLAKQKADRVNSQFVTDPEWNVYINQSYFELYDLIVQKYGDDYYVAPPLYITTTGSQLYDLPNGVNNSGAKPFYKLLGVDLAIAETTDAWITLQRFNFIERNRYVYPQITTSLLGIAGLRYRLLGDQLEFIPTPAANQQFRIWYVPRMTTLLQDIDVVDGVSGWTEYIAIDAAIKALQKEESDVSVLAAQKMMMIQRIEAAAENRDAGEPMTISDTRRNTDLYGMGGGGTNGPWGGA